MLQKPGILSQSSPFGKEPIYGFPVQELKLEIAADDNFTAFLAGSLT